MIRLFAELSGHYPSQPTIHQLVNPNCYGAPTMAVSNSVQSRLNFEQRTKTPIMIRRDAISLPRFRALGGSTQERPNRSSFVRTSFEADASASILEFPRMAAIRKPFQSKLIPHLEFIRECRGQAMSYQCISAELRAHFGTPLSLAPARCFLWKRSPLARGFFG